MKLSCIHVQEFEERFVTDIPISVYFSYAYKCLYRIFITAKSAKKPFGPSQLVSWNEFTSFECCQNYVCFDAGDFQQWKADEKATRSNRRIFEWKVLHASVLFYSYTYAKVCELGSTYSQLNTDVW